MAKGDEATTLARIEAGARAYVRAAVGLALGMCESEGGPTCILGDSRRNNALAGEHLPRTTYDVTMHHAPRTTHHVTTYHVTTNHVPLNWQRRTGARCLSMMIHSPCEPHQALALLMMTSPKASLTSMTTLISDHGTASAPPCRYGTLLI